MYIQMLKYTYIEINILYIEAEIFDTVQNSVLLPIFGFKKEEKLEIKNVFQRYVSS